MPQKLLPAMVVGRAILPAAAFQAALSCKREIFMRRLKVGGSQDWLPHVCR
jgi:hypothetical protein